MDAILIATTLLAWGAHAVIPGRLDNRPTALRLWRIAALPTACAAGLALAASIANFPDRAIAAGVGPLPFGSPLSLAVSGALLILFATDVLVATGGAKLGRQGLRLAAWIGVLALVPISWFGELLRLGEGPQSSVVAVVLATVGRIGLALAAGEVFAQGRPRWAALAPAALVLSFFALPSPVRSVLAQSGDPVTYLAAAIVLGSARWLPVSLRRPSLIAGTALTAIALARAASVSAALAGFAAAPGS